jgi:hypothetical protein
MSTIEEVRAAEKKLQGLVNALRTGANDPDNLNIQVMNASEGYARAVRELSHNLLTLERRTGQHEKRAISKITWPSNFGWVGFSRLQRDAEMRSLQEASLCPALHCTMDRRQCTPGARFRRESVDRDF